MNRRRHPHPLRLRLYVSDRLEPAALKAILAKIAEYTRVGFTGAGELVAALRMEAGLGIAARLWLSMQAACDLHKARANTDVSGVHLHPGVLAAPAEERPGK
ncbi:hypothetical protein [Pantoea sp. SGAir0418]